MSARETNLNFGDLYHSFPIYHMVRHHPKFSSNPHGSVQDEHDCLKVSFLSLMYIHKRGGISATVMGRPVILKVWNIVFVGDTSENNRWLGHFNGSGKMTCSYRDSVCPFHDMDSVMPHCQYITIADYYWNKSIRSSLSTNAGAKKDVDKSWSKHDIDNDFMQPHCLYQTRSMVYST